MTLSELILKILLSGNSFSYAQLLENGTRPSDFNRELAVKDIKSQTLKTTLYRLKIRGLLENKNNLWKITKKGAEYLQKNSKRLKRFNKFKIKNNAKNMIIIFDIPELYKKRRDWLRIELTGLGFLMLQRSVWFGPAPLPKEFIQYLNELNLLGYMKFFKAEEKDIA